MNFIILLLKTIIKWFVTSLNYHVKISSLKQWIIIFPIIHPIQFVILLFFIAIGYRVMFYTENITCELFDPTLKKITTLTISPKGLEYGKHILNESFIVFKNNQNITSKKALELLFDMLILDTNRDKWFGHVQYTNDIGHLIMLRNVQSMNEGTGESQLLFLVQMAFHSFTELNMDKTIFMHKLYTTSYFNLLHTDYVNWTLLCKIELKMGYLKVLYACIYVLPGTLISRKTLYSCAHKKNSTHTQLSLKLYIILSLLALGIFKEYIVINQEIIIYVTFLSLAYIIISQATNTVVDLFNSNTQSIKQDLNINSRKINDSMNNIIRLNAVYGVLNTQIDLNIPEITREVSPVFLMSEDI